MTKNYTTTLSAAEDAALSYVAISQDDWIQNAVHDRCRVAIDEIVQITISKCLESNIQIPGSKDEMVSLAFENSWIKTAAVRQAEADKLIAEQSAQIAAQQAAQ